LQEAHKRNYKATSASKRAEIEDFGEDIYEIPKKEIDILSIEEWIRPKACRVSRILTPSAINNSKHFDPSEFQAF
jgi:hypothetical protein